MRRYQPAGITTRIELPDLRVTSELRSAALVERLEALSPLAVGITWVSTGQQRIERFGTKRRKSLPHKGISGAPRRI
jgi:hypothetical protein